MVKTKGRCSVCGTECTPIKARTHLLECTAQAKSTTKGYLVRVSWAAQPNLYWMFIALPQEASLSLLDQFLRNTWVECCGHLSEFIIEDYCYESHTESGSSSHSMNKKVEQLLSPGMQFEYVYDMGSSTRLILGVMDAITIGTPKKITILMRNDLPVFPCESCKMPSEIICSFCGKRMCSDCSEEHPCAVEEDETYMLTPLLNSPRSGVCGYGG